MHIAMLTGFALSHNQQGFQHHLVTIFKYLFVHLNVTPGLFIFVIYVRITTEKQPVKTI